MFGMFKKKKQTRKKKPQTAQYGNKSLICSCKIWSLQMSVSYWICNLVYYQDSQDDLIRSLYLLACKGIIRKSAVMEPGQPHRRCLF